MTKINILRGDITKQEIRAIVNAANRTLLGGGGVDGAIHRAAGPELLEVCRKLDGCETGQAKITKGYDLPSEFVIHTVGPVYKDGGHGERDLLKNCYLNSLKLAKENGIKSVAFPAISTGIYGYPKEEAAKIVSLTIKEFIKNDKWFEEIRFIIHSDADYELYRKSFKSMGLVV